MASSDVTQMFSAIVGNVGTRFWKQTTGLGHFFTTNRLIIDYFINQNWLNMRPNVLYSTDFSSFPKPGAYTNVAILPKTCKHTLMCNPLLRSSRHQILGKEEKCVEQKF